MSKSRFLFHAIFERAQEYPTRIAIDTGHQRITYAQFKLLVLAHAFHLQQRGAHQSSVLAIDVQHPIANFCLAIACSLVGCSWVHPTKAAIANQSLGITHFVFDRPVRPPFQTKVLVVDPSWASLPLDQKEISETHFQGSKSSSETWMFAQSSGTTGTPKFMKLSEDNMSARMYYPIDLPEGEPIRCASLGQALSPMGLFSAIRIWHLGGTVVLAMTFDLLTKIGANIVAGSPMHLENLCRAYVGPIETKIHSAIVSGGKPTPRFFQLMFDRFELIRNGYGSTEAGLTSSKIISPTNVEDASAGPPHDQVRVEIVDLENNPLPTDAEGIVRIRTKGQVSGYVGELVVNAEAFQDGWFYPGDLGRMSGGELYITGRSNDQLNIGGVKINAIAIDDALMSVSGVRDAICFANADTDALPALAALLVIAPKADADQTVREARRILRSKFGLARTPKEFFVMDAAPRNENGKAQRHLAAAAVRGLKPIP